jgi:hypothetical protein
MDKDWLKQMDPGAANDLMSLLHRVSEAAADAQLDSEDVHKLNEFLAAESCLAVQRAELILEELGEHEVDGKPASEVLSTLRTVVPSKYLVLRDLRQSD